MITGKSFRRRTRIVDGQAFEVVWDGRRGAPSLLPSDYPQTDASIAPVQDTETDELLPTDYPARTEQDSVSWSDVRTAITDRSRRSAGRFEN